MFRIAVYEIGFYMTKCDKKDTAVAGSFATGFSRMMATLNLNYTLVWIANAAERAGWPNMTSGMYNGALGLVQRNEADMILWQSMDRIPINEPFNIGPTLRNEEGAIGSKVVVTFNRADVLRSMMCISPTIALLVLIALFLIEALIAFNEGNVKSRRAMNVWRLFRLIFAQAHYRPIKVLSQALIALIAATSMFFMFYWENSMATDMFAPDTSQIIRTLDDVLRNESLKVLMIKGTPIYERFKEARRKTKRGEIFRMVNQNELYTNTKSDARASQLASKLRAEIERRDSVAIHTAAALNLLAQSVCLSSANEGNFSISKEKFFPIHMAPIYGKNLSSEKRAFLDKRFYRAFESGLLSFNYDNYGISLKSPLEDKGMLTVDKANALKKCVITDLQEFISELQKTYHLDQMSNQDLIGLWAVTAAGLAAATLVAAVEKMCPKRPTAHKKLFYKRK